VIVAIISDIHANLPALEAVIEDAGAPDLWICAGDVVGYYSEPNEVCDRLRGLEARVIRGNHDGYVIGALQPDPAREPHYRTNWTVAALTPNNLEWLRALPSEDTVHVGEMRVRVRHASPWDEETYIYPDSPRWQEIELPQREVLVLGHTHHPLRRRCGSGWVVNPGSVGQPRDRDPRAGYALLDASDGAITMRRVPYPVAAVQQQLRAQNWPTQMIAILSRTE